MTYDADAPTVGYSASEKFEIIELVEQSSLSIRRTLAPIGIPRSTFYDWYSRYQEGGIEALEDGKPRPRRIWNKIPDKIETAIVNLALEEPDLSPRELAVNFTDTQGSFVSEATVYRLLKDHGLITSPAFILMKAADRFANPTTAPNQLWQTDFTYLKVIGWGWFYLSTVLDDFSRYILAWKLCTTMAASDVADTLRALEADARTLQADTTTESDAHDTLAITQLQYKAGGVSYLALLNAQRTYLQARQVRIQAEAARYADTAALFQALGGGWWNRDNGKESR